MTEGEYLVCQHSWELYFYLGSLPSAARHKASRRKHRLSGCARCRWLWLALPDPRSRAAVEVAELLADGRAQPTDVQFVREAAGEAVAAASDHGLAVAAVHTLDPRFAYFATAGLNPPIPWKADLQRCIFGNPFRPAKLDPAWLRWNCGQLRRMAEEVYLERAFDRLPVLADALEDAGCADGQVLGHLRGPGPHARGCWVVDALMGKA